MKLGNLASRVAVAVIAVPILLFIIYQHRPEPVWVTVFVAAIIAMSEFFAMTLESRADRVAGTVTGAVAIAVLYWLPVAFPEADGVFLLLAMFCAVAPIFLYYLFRLGDMETSATRMAMTVTGIFYGGFLFTFLAFIKRDFGPMGGHFVVLVLVVAWMADTGAYTFGRLWGNRKLYPAVSPKKTRAGALGGVVGSVIGASVVRVLFLDHMGWADILVIAAVGSVLGQLGDLAESLIKRSRGVKDSGTILGGHGGILDRCDAVLFIAPFVYLYLQIRLLTM
ncbi:MAG TPA: phosphatidate cytidylyltransferase [Kofleriaceae bacterium]|nr:phosphatidate cytidylyltransferase [Kofleriaceae bacterium]